ncbi:MAG TPA: hypothetical protein VG848_00460 [Acetobacteraceae bacterium]|nr:hypothetical protein [Acetobacteraceae bacterium]
MGSADLARLRTLWRVARRAFKDSDKAERFLTAPHPMLDMRCPVECAMRSKAALAEAVALIRRMLQGTAG